MTESTIDWDDEARELIRWFDHNRHRLPRSSFWFWPQSHRVSDPDRFFSSLAADIASGPNGVRARNGAIQDDLRRLRELFGERLKRQPSGRLLLGAETASA